MKQSKLYISLKIIALHIVISTCLSFSNPALSATNDSVIVFVHGAHLTANSWQEVALSLKEKGYQSMAVNLPGREDNINPKDITLNSSAKYLCDAINSLNKKITFVTHSQGGAVVNHAQSICPSVEVDRIIYLASVSPLKGEKPFDRLSKEDETNYFKGVGYDENTGLMIINNKDAFVESFSSNSNPSQREAILTSSVSEPAYIADGIVNNDIKKFSAIRKFYIFTEQDKIISMASQVKIEKQLKTIKTSSINSGHIPMITHPDDLVSILLDFMVI